MALARAAEVRARTYAWHVSMEIDGMRCSGRRAALCLVVGRVECKCDPRARRSDSDAGRRGSAGSGSRVLPHTEGSCSPLWRSLRETVCF